MNWAEIIQLHAEARAAFADAAAAIPPVEWSHEKEPDKWTPAHVLTHLSLAYEVLLSELNGGPGMKIKFPFWKRTILRFTMVPGLMKGNPFPQGARAPRETRPEKINPNQAEAVEAFRMLSAQFEQEVQSAYSKDRSIQLTHAYFGCSNLPNCVQLCARHVEHHTRMLAQFQA